MLAVESANGGRNDLEHRLYRMAAMVYEAEDAIISLTPGGTILSWNRGAQHIYGYAGNEAVGRSVSIIVPPEQNEEFEGWIVTVRQGERVRRDTRAQSRNGMSVEVALTMSPLRDAAGCVDGISLITRDMTRERWMAATLQSTLDSLETALAAAKESESQSRRFLADAAHQLRTPIAGIRASAETLLQESVPNRREELLANVLRETSRAARLMSGLLRMAGVDQGQIPTPVPCDLVALCGQELERVADLAPTLGVAVRVGRPLNGLPVLDPDLVREILANLLDNARRHAVSRIEVTVEEAGSGVVVSVVDDGPGLSPATEGRAFERFVSLDGHGGSGLGLAIAKGLARALDGDLVYEDGSFVLWLPAEGRIVPCGGASQPSTEASG